jgi:hypothetical protein
MNAAAQSDRAEQEAEPPGAVYREQREGVKHADRLPKGAAALLDPGSIGDPICANGLRHLR